MSAVIDSDQPVVAGRSARKRQAVLHRARQLFLEKGYAGTSMDEVAALAEVSKVTIYRHFSDKHSLFVAVVTEAIDDAKAGSQTLVDQLGSSTDVERDLRDFARRHVALVTQPHLIQMRRMIIAEAHRFPDLAKAWHRIGPERGHATLASQIDRLVERGLARCARPAARCSAAELPDLVGAPERGDVHRPRQALHSPLPEPLRRRSRTGLPCRIRDGPFMTQTRIWMCAN